MLDTSLFERAKDALQVKDFQRAAELFAQCKDISDVYGEADHLNGNALMKLGLYNEAIQAYHRALNDSSYAKQGAVCTNLGKAYTAAGDIAQARSSFERAIADPHYACRYKASMALGALHRKMGNVKEAGIAYRSAALDQENPEPGHALINLGICFMEMSRPGDAIEAYRTALDFPLNDQLAARAYSNLGQAYVATSRMDEAYSSFEKALSKPGFVLNPAAEADYKTSKEVLATRKRAAATTGSSTADFLNSMYGDPSNSGVVMPSPEDTGFFDYSEKDLVKYSKEQLKQDRKTKHTGLKILLIILALIALLIICLGWGYTQGLGYPTQTSQIESLFDKINKTQDTRELWSRKISDDELKLRERALPKSSGLKIVATESNSAQSTSRVHVTLPEGGQVYYLISLIREGLGWKVQDTRLDFNGQSTQGSAQGTEQPSGVQTPASTNAGAGTKQGASFAPAGQKPAAQSAPAQKAPEEPGNPADQTGADQTTNPAATQGNAGQTTVPAGAQPASTQPGDAR